MSPHYPPVSGGVGDHVFHLSRAVATFGIEPVVVTSLRRDGAAPPGVPMHAVVERWEAAAVGPIAAAIRALRPDVVNLHFSPYMYDRYGVAPWLADLARATGVRWVTTFHEVAVRMQWRQPKSWPLAVLQRRAALRLADASSALVSTLPYYRRLLPSPSTPTHVIPVGSNVPPVALGDDAVGRLRARLAGPNDVVLASFGAGTSWRRTDVLLRALARARSEAAGAGIRLVLIGDQGEPGRTDRRALDALVAELGLLATVHVTGRLPAPEVFAHLRAADLFVLLDSDPYGGVSTKSTSLAAAFGAGLPLLGNRGLLTDPLLRHGENIHLVDSLEVGHVARALAALVNDPEERRRLARGSRETYRRHLAWDVLGARYAEALRGA